MNEFFNESNFIDVLSNGQKKTALEQWLKSKGLTPSVVVHIDDDPVDELNFTADSILHDTKVKIVRVLPTIKKAGKIEEYTTGTGDIIQEKIPTVEAVQGLIDDDGLPVIIWPEQASAQIGMIALATLICEDLPDLKNYSTTLSLPESLQSGI